MQSESLFHRTDIFHENLLGFLEGDRDFTELKHVCVWHERLGYCRGAHLQVQSLHNSAIPLSGVHVAEIDGQKPVVVLGSRMGQLHFEVSYIAAHRFQDSVFVEAVLESSQSGQLLLLSLLLETLLLSLFLFDLLRGLFDRFARGGLRVFFLGCLSGRCFTTLTLGVGETRGGISFLLLLLYPFLELAVAASFCNTEAFRLFLGLRGHNVFMGLVGQISEQRVEFNGY